MEYAPLNYVYRRESDGRPILNNITKMPLDILIPMLIGENSDQTQEQIAESFQLSKAQIYAALAFYYTYPEEVEAWIESTRQLMETYREQSEAFWARVHAGTIDEDSL